MLKTLSARLTYRIMAVVLVMMAIIAGVVSFTVRAYMLDEANERYLNFLLENNQEIRRMLSEVSVATQNNVHEIERDIDHPDKMFEHLERIVRQNPAIACGSMLFEQGYYPSEGQVFIPCARRDTAGNIRVVRIDSTYHSEFLDVWFHEMLKKDSCTWTKPYYENQHFAGDQEPRLLTTFAIPIHDQDGRTVALLGADLSLDDLRDHMMKDIEEMNNQYEKGQQYHSFFFIIDREGTYVMHPDKERMLKHFDRSVGKMMAKFRGTCLTEVDGVMSRLFYRTINNIDWVLVVVSPKETVLSKAYRLNILILVMMIIGLLAIYLFCHYQIKKTTKPLQRFAQSADEMAMGNFSSPLPDIKGGDEVRQLHDAFANMQTSLSIFVDELQKTTTQKATLEHELKIANAIQMAMLPKTTETHAAVDLYASLTPAREVGGDLYDYFIRDNRLFFCIGDVSGKGVPAALLMAVMKSMFRSETRRADSAVAIVDMLNCNLTEEYSAGYFVTMFVGILDLASGLLDYCNAGHEPPLIAGQPLDVKLNLPVGALSDWDYEGQQTQLHAGDMLFLYTDGLSEAKNTVGEQLGRKLVQQLAIEHASDSARQLVELMETEVHRHADDAEQSDDITLLAIKWQNQGDLLLRASMDDIGRLEPFIADVAQRGGLDGREAKRLRLAVEEAVANIINHGQATSIKFQATMEDNQLVLTIDDDGQPFDPTASATTDFSIPADERPPGGLGIMFLHKMTDSLDYQRIDGHNILTIRKSRSHRH